MAIYIYILAIYAQKWYLPFTYDDNSRFGHGVAYLKMME